MKWGLRSIGYVAIPVGIVLLRVVFAAIVLVAIWRPAIRDLRGMPAREVVLFGVALAAGATSNEIVASLPVSPTVVRRPWS